MKITIEVKETSAGYIMLALEERLPGLTIEEFVKFAALVAGSREEDGRGIGLDFMDRLDAIEEPEGLDEDELDAWTKEQFRAILEDY